MKLFARKSAPEASAIPAYKNTPAGQRVCLVTLDDGVSWELINHQPVPQLTLRQLNDRDCAHPTFIIGGQDMQDLIFEKGELLNRKKAEALLKGRWLDGWEPGTCVLAQDPLSAEDRAAGVHPDIYGLPLKTLIAHFMEQWKSAMTVAPSP